MGREVEPLPDDLRDPALLAELRHVVVQMAIRGVKEGIYQKGEQCINADGTPAFRLVRSEPILLKYMGILPELNGKSWGEPAEDPLANLTAAEARTLKGLRDKLKAQEIEDAG